MHTTANKAALSPLARRASEGERTSKTEARAVACTRAAPTHSHVDHLRSSGAAIKFLSIEPLLEDLGDINLTDIAWAIVGGESGAGARPMKPDWVIRIRKQCQRAGVPFFFKQWGGVRKGKTGRELEGRTFDEMPCDVASIDGNHLQV